MTLERDEKVEGLFHAALGLDASSRTAFLQQACGTDVELRQAVERLLHNHQQAGDFLNAPIWQVEAEAESLAAATSGQQLSHYRILSLLGRGGMGEVWLAQDQRLGRKVALKMLPAEFTVHRDRLHRFEQEARASSALNHPNILTIYEFGEEQGIHFIATEFIDGVTLRQHADERRLVQAEALDVAIQIASALNAAHEAGIIHRDIKPENVMLRRDGLVKVLDFGLAKLTEVRPAALKHDSQMTTQAKVDTLPGTVLGTPRYMSPEQARGQSLDTRTDIFSLGVMLYELLAGQPPFSGTSAVEVLAAILEREPQYITTHLPSAPPELARIVHKALRKDPDERYQSIKDLLVDLKELREELSFAARRDRTTAATAHDPSLSLSSQAPARTRYGSRFVTAAIVISVILLAAVIGVVFSQWIVGKRGGPASAPSPAELKYIEAVRWRGAPGELYSIGTLSPDLRWVAFTSSENGSRNIWLKQLGTAASQAFPVTRDEFNNDLPLWSPGGDELAFCSSRGKDVGIWRMPFSGGMPAFIKADPERDSELRYWSPDGKIIYYEKNQNLFALHLNTGEVDQLTKFDPKVINVSSISISPDEKRIAYFTYDADDRYRLWVIERGASQPKKIAEELTSARETAWHPDNRRIIYSASRDGVYQLFVADTEGHQPTQITFGKTDCYALEVSRDGTKILYGASAEESDIWGVRLADAGEFAVASDITAELWPDVSPVGSNIAYQSIQNLSQGSRMAMGDLLTKAAKPDDGTEQPFRLAHEGMLPKWSPDGSRLAFIRQAGIEYHLWSVSAQGAEERQITARPLLPVSRNMLPCQRLQNSYFDWSPDGSKLAYLSLHAPRNVWVVNADGSNDSQISDNRDADSWLACPLWASDGNKIAYSSESFDRGIYSIWLTDLAAKATRQLYKTGLKTRLIGWAQGDQGLILASVQSQQSANAFNGLLREVDLTLLSAATGEQHLLVKLPSAYFYNIYLSPDRKTVAFTSRLDGNDNVWLSPISGGAAKKLTSNRDPRLYFSSLAWSRDGRTIYFGKQTRHSLLGLITNFK